MKRFLLTSLTAGMLATSAMAADMRPAPMLTKAPMVAPAFSWTGCYIGAGAGYGMWNQESFGESDPGHVAFTADTTSGGKGWFGTAGAGCDYQVNSYIVIGAFGDWDFGDIKGDFSAPGFDLVGSESEKWAWGAGGRIGWLVTPTVLTYFSGGYTQAHFDGVSFGDLFVGPAVASMGANTYNGWFLGSGFDYAISILPSGFFLRSEYRYSTYNAVDLPILDVAGVSIGAVNSKKFVQTVRSELTYRFNWSR
jgi:outer membrane immunogenic protein